MGGTRTAARRGPARQWPARQREGAWARGAFVWRQPLGFRRLGGRPGIALLVGLAVSVACSQEPQVYEGRGVVREVQRDYEQLVIAHQEIPGLMSAMTMNFDVADPAFLDRAEAGQAVAFELVHDGRSYRIVGLEVLGDPASAHGSGGPEGGPSLEDLASLGEAPPIALVDQHGEPLALADLRGQAVVLDFIYTRCPGPCPALTGLLQDARGELAPELRRRTRFVSVSLDPVHDTPAVLRAWAEQRGLEPEGWSLLTGSEEDVQEVLGRYGVGSVRLASGEIDHLVATFLIDPRGHIVERYVGLDHEPEEIAADVARILS